MTRQGSTRFLMMASAVALGAAGLAASFAPVELLAAWGAPVSPQAAVLVQLTGALFFGFALLNWMAKGVMIGGIYARPVALGNFLHFGMGALALVKHVDLREPGAPMALGLAVYIVFAVLFGLLLFRPLASRAE